MFYDSMNGASETLNASRLWAGAWRQKWLIVACLGVFLALGVAYVKFSVPVFKAYTSLLIDSQTQMGIDSNSASQTSVIDVSRVDSQTSIFYSDQLIRDSIQSLSPEMARALNWDMYILELPLKNKVKNMFVKSPVADAIANDSDIDIEQAADYLRRHVNVQRVDNTYVLDIVFSSSNPELAAAIPNAFVAAYLKSLDDLRKESDRRQLAVVQLRIADVSNSIADIEGQRLKVTSQSGTLNDMVVQRRKLELDSSRLERELDALLIEQNTLLQQQAAITTGGKVIVKAATPEAPSSPRVSIALIISTFMGLAVGAGIATLREITDGTVRTEADITRDFGFRYLGLIPEVRRFWPRRSRLFMTSPTGHVEIPLRLAHAKVFQLSRYAETVRMARLQVDAKAKDGAGQIVGITSASPGDGKSTFAANFALALAEGQSRVLLIDGDVRHLSLSKSLAPKSELGLVDAMAALETRATVDVSDYVTSVEGLNMDFLPVGLWRDRSKAANVDLSKVETLLNGLTSTYNYIVIDLPPAGIVATSRALMLSSNHVIFATRWGKTEKRHVHQILDAEPELHSRILGFIMNRVNMSKLRSYERGGRGFSSYYDKYFAESKRT